MARLTIPEDFNSQVTLLNNIIAQNTALGTSSPLTAFLVQQNIVLTNDEAAATAAQTHDAARALLKKQSENYRQLRDNYFTAPWAHLTGSVQFLKTFYKGNTKELGNWGITITDSGKVNYPAAFTQRSAVFITFTAKHNSYPDNSSPLQPFLTLQNINLDADSALVEQATTNNTSFTATAQQSENETELRNQIWMPVLTHIKTIGNYLMKLFSNNQKALGNWGFVVDENTQKARLRTSKLKPGETSVYAGLIVGGSITNIGTVDIHLYKGETTTGTPSIIHVGEQFGLVKGYSTVTVVNPSTLIEAKFTALSAH
ncbi:hypothetical protein [Parafilimonas terrae]|uniref:Uncharacterized protein n=1 Tax=Parafilimonas terrae TaxID=1465490 RepID=A0A1I5YGY6_9BACT|nr:hypothetical protein [Parafilimonas terrae]SFQ43491.1 hypothetical protein SAMN05444277_11237 [Parafilimonas terrae]